MVQMIVDDQQAKVIAEASGVVEVMDHAGRVLGYVTHGFTEEDIALAERARASQQPGFTTEEVLRRLEALER